MDDTSLCASEWSHVFTRICLFSRLSPVFLGADSVAKVHGHVAAQSYLPSSKSSRKSATTSLDQSCPMTSIARHSLLRSYTSKPKEVSLAEQGTDPFRAFRKTVSLPYLLNQAIANS